MIKVLICDGDGTLDLPDPAQELRDLVDTLQDLGVGITVASNDTGPAGIKRYFQSAQFPIPEIIVTRAEMPKPKPYPEYVRRIEQLAEVSPTEVIFLGDSDKTDALCAINAGVLPFAAIYANSAMKYGLPVSHPKALSDWLRTFGGQEPPYFGWTCSANASDGSGRVEVRVLLWDQSGQMRNGNNLRDALKSVLKDQSDIRIGSNSIPLQSILFHYLVSQCYMSGLMYGVDYVTVYPGHLVGSNNPLLAEFSRLLAPLFRDNFVPDLLLRHRDAPESKRQGNARDIFDQFQTILVNPEYRNKIRGKTVLVLDDYTTAGFSLETARRMLIQAGAASIVSVAVAKFRNGQCQTIITKDWDPFVPCSLARSDMRTIQLPGSINIAADRYFKDEILPYYEK